MPNAITIICKHYKHNIKRFVQFFENVFGVKEETDEQTVIKGINAMQEFFASIGMPTKLSDFNIPKDKVEQLAIHCSQNKTISVKSYIPLGYKEVKEIFELCY